MYRILLVEDDFDIRELISDYFVAKSEGNITVDLAVVCDMKKGETCYFVVTSYEYYGDAFYLGVKDIKDYQSII